jgi:hypothetical protein
MKDNLFILYTAANISCNIWRFLHIKDLVFSPWQL